MYFNITHQVTTLRLQLVFLSTLYNIQTQVDSGIQSRRRGMAIITDTYVNVAKLCRISSVNVCRCL